ncbi:S-norcoclaurine synthase 1 [Carex littledalei]|uniref:S-norcoclaurine synthase 1 n=1 Tax=Carex littledalei TaxID=544730 RepID=A0A833RMV2_9POAL|nr:S-norcoclaurine synthase 1 [Carex littledalei]
MERYIRPEMNSDDMFSGDSSKEIPVIDMSRLLDEMSREEEASKLKHACQEWGFFQINGEEDAKVSTRIASVEMKSIYGILFPITMQFCFGQVVNHGVAEKVIEEMKDDIKGIL